MTGKWFDGTASRPRVVVAALALVVAGCGSDEVPTTSDGLLSIKYTAGAATVSDWDDYVAEDNGFYKDSGCALDRIETQSAGPATQLLVTGEANVGRGLPPAVLANKGSSGGVRLITVADMLIRPPYVVVSKGVSTWDGLRGKVVGVASPTDTGAVVIADVLRAKGLPKGSVDMVSTGGTSERYAALKTGALAATMLLPPVSFTAVDEGMTNLGYLPEILGPDWTFAFTSIIVNPEWASVNEKAIRCVLTARDKALRWLADPANKARAVAILAKATKVTPQVAERTYNLLKIATPISAFADRVGVQQAAVQRVLDDLQASGLIEQSLKAADYSNDSFAAAVRAGSGP